MVFLLVCALNGQCSGYKSLISMLTRAVSKYEAKSASIATVTAGIAMGIALNIPLVAHADMLTFPLKEPLKNNIVLMRAGESYADQKGVIETNPVKKLAMSNGLTEEGRQQVVQAANELKKMDFLVTYIWTSNTERAYESAAALAQELEMGQNRIVPEYSFLDARAAGFYEGKPIKESWDVVHERDATEGIKFRPPPNNDGTPSESVSDVLVRMNQVMSTIDAMYSGENVVVVAPDSEILQTLQAAVADLNPDASLPLHTRFAMNHGEVRLLTPLVKPSNTLASGQTQEEANSASRRAKASLVGGSINRERLKTTRGSNTWLDLWKTTV